MAVQRNYDLQKAAAAKAAVDQIEPGMIVGLGTGSTVAYALTELGTRVKDGLKITGIPTSEATAQTASQLGIPLTDFAHDTAIDLTLDGADEVERGTWDLIKGAGGALLREKIVASASKRLLIMIDERKLVARLGQSMPLPVEILTFASPLILQRLSDAGFQPKLRVKGGEPYLTDSGNHIADCLIGSRKSHDLLRELDQMVGVVDCGLFLDFSPTVVVGTECGAVFLPLGST